MPLPRLSWLVLALSLFAPYGPVRAQSRPDSPSPPMLSVDLAVGAGNMRHRPFATAEGVHAEGVVAGRFFSRSGISLVGAMNGFVRVLGLINSLECRVEVGTTTGCYGRASLIPTVAVLGGAEFRRHGTALRALAGPIAYVEEGESRRIGSHVRLDLAVPASSSIAFVLATRMSYLGRIRGEAIEIFSMSAGVRLQR